jgi:hypothetical protein
MEALVDLSVGQPPETFKSHRPDNFQSPSCITAFSRLFLCFQYL